MSRTRKPLASLLTATFAAAMLATTGMGAMAEKPLAGETVRQAFPTLSLARKHSSGREAIMQLGSRLPEVAAWYGKSVRELEHELLTDRRMRVDQSGRLLAVEELEAPVPATTASLAQGSIQNGALLGLDQTFRLHSRPGAARTIYLDFNGASISGTAWNTTASTITAQPFDLDGNQASFSTTELQRIQYIWQRVAEDYAVFDVDVTTEQPTADALTRTNAADQVYGTTVVITKTAGVYSCSCGGIAYVGVFNYAGGGSYPANYYKPAFVFYDMLGGGNEKAVAEAISHEAGHNVGLHHDATTTESYYAGQGNGAATGWAPIMGVGYYKPLVQFSKGEYSGASNTEDDFAVARSFGLPLRNDDAGNTSATARRLQSTISGTAASVTVGGVITSGSDRDVFAVDASAGAFTAALLPASRSANGDFVLTLLDAGGRVLARANPLDALGANISVNLPAQGTYYLEVRGTGQGSAATTGYSNYGSVGNFRLKANFVAPVGAAPTAVLAASVTSGAGPLSVTLNGTQSKDDGRITRWYWDFGDGSSDLTGTLSSVGHVYRTAGVYTARLTVVDNTGLISRTTVKITVTSTTAQADLGAGLRTFI